MIGKINRTARVSHGAFEYVNLISNLLEGSFSERKELFEEMMDEMDFLFVGYDIKRGIKLNNSSAIEYSFSFFYSKNPKQIAEERSNFRKEKEYWPKEDDDYTPRLTLNKKRYDKLREKIKEFNLQYPKQGHIFFKEAIELSLYICCKEKGLI